MQAPCPFPTPRPTQLFCLDIIYEVKYLAEFSEPL